MLRISDHTACRFRGKNADFPLTLEGRYCAPPRSCRQKQPRCGLFLLFRQPGDVRQMECARSPALSRVQHKSFRGRDGGVGGKGGPLFQKGSSLPPDTPTACPLSTQRCQSVSTLKKSKRSIADARAPLPLRISLCPRLSLQTFP